MSYDELKAIYDDTSGWLKFIEAKLAVFLTFETGLIYFLIKLNEGHEKNLLFLILELIGVLVSIILIIGALLPTINKSLNPLYFMSWTDKGYDYTDSIKHEHYKKQIREVAQVSKRKMCFLRYSIIIYVLSIILVVIGTYC